MYSNGLESINNNQIIYSEIRIKKIVNLVFMVIYFTVAQDLICAFILNMGIPAKIIKLIYYAKEILILYIGFICMYPSIKKGFRIKNYNIPFIIFVSIIVLYILIGTFNNDFIAALMGARQYIIPIVMLVIGLYFGSHNSSCILKVVDRKIYVFSLFLIVSTLIERILLPVDFWNEVNMVHFSQVVKGNVADLDSNLIQNFYTGGKRRALGVAAEPLLLAYTIIPLFSYYLGRGFLYRNKAQKDFILLSGLFICQILSLTRAIIVSELVGVMVVVFAAFCKRKKLSKNFMLIIGSVLIVTIVIFREKIFHIIYITMNNMDGGSAGMHMYQLKKGISYMFEYYYGLGTGSGSNLVASQGGVNLTTEFAYSNLTVDLGIGGLVTYVFGLLVYFLSFINGIKKNEDARWNSLYLGMAFCIIIWLVSGIFSPQMWAMKAILLSWLLFGFSMGHLKTKVKIYEK